MCQLFATSFNEKLNINYSFRGFRTRGEGNPHGWGLAWYPDSGVQIMKEPVKAGRSQLADFLQKYSKVRSKTFIGHVRRVSVGGINYSNTHPFSRENDGRDYSFAHNGTISTGNLTEEFFVPVGGTDSEKAFCHLMDIIKGRNISSIQREHFELIHDTFREINQNGDFNCIFSDGEYLFCYHDRQGYNGLYYLNRKAPFSRTRYIDEDIEVDFSLHKEPGQEGYVIASHPLTEENWTRFGAGEMIVFKDGKKIYSSSEREEQVTTRLADLDVIILDKIRESENRISIGDICSSTGLSHRMVKKAIEKLMNHEFIRQDRRDVTPWDHRNSTYYTLRKSRPEIQDILVRGVESEEEPAIDSKKLCYACKSEITSISGNCFTCGMPEPRKSDRKRAEKLATLWNVDCYQSRFGTQGWYHPLTDFPAAYFDEYGYVLFKSRDDFINCKQLKIKKDVNAVGKSLQNVDSYVRMKFEDGVWKQIK